MQSTKIYYYVDNMLAMQTLMMPAPISMGPTPIPVGPHKPSETKLLAIHSAHTQSQSTPQHQMHSQQQQSQQQQQQQQQISAGNKQGNEMIMKGYNIHETVYVLLYIHTYTHTHTAVF